MALFQARAIPKTLVFGTIAVISGQKEKAMNARKPRRVAIYARVSTGSQTVENQLRELREIAERHGWFVAAEFRDAGISGAKGRDQRPGLNRLMHAISRREIDVVAAWSVDRLGRSLQDLLGFLGELHAKNVDLYLHQQGLDTSTPAGKALFQMMGVFAEFERAMIRERVRAGLARAKAQGKKLGRRRNDDPNRVAEVRHLRSEGMGIGRVAKALGIGVSYIQRLEHQTRSK
jgi:DNA invertase Pin-like site-specific DNA recombinase